MTRLNYHPAEGSLAARLIAALEAGTGSMTNKEAATLLEVPIKNIQPSCKAAIAAGQLHHYSGGRGKVFYYLPGANVPTGEGDASPAPTKRKKRQAAPDVEQTTDEPEEPTAVAALWEDGDVVLQGIQINSDGCSVTLTDTVARRVHRFLERIYGRTA